MNIILPEKIPAKPCVFSISCNEKEYIGHSMSLTWLADEITKTYGKYHRNGVRTDNLYYPLVKEYYGMVKPAMIITVLFETDNGYDLLKYELEMLAGLYGTSKCINASPIPYVPKNVHLKRGSAWLTKNQYLNFMKLLKKYEIKKEQQ